jgi:hypothetical protein
MMMCWTHDFFLVLTRDLEDQRSSPLDSMNGGTWDKNIYLRQEGVLIILGPDGETIYERCIYSHTHEEPSRCH